MAYGIVEQYTFGSSFPNADFFGWEDQIQRHFDKELSEEMRAQYGGRAVKYRGEISRKFTLGLGRLEVHERPVELRLRERPKALGAVIVMRGRLLAIHDTLKQILTRLEPDIHQIWPITITAPNGALYSSSYSALVIGRFLDSFLPHLSAQSSWCEIEPQIYSVAAAPSKATYASLALSAHVIGSTNLWRESKLINPHFYFSDTLHDEVLKNGLSIPPAYRLTVA